MHAVHFVWIFLDNIIFYRDVEMINNYLGFDE